VEFPSTTLFTALTRGLVCKRILTKRKNPKNLPQRILTDERKNRGNWMGTKWCSVIREPKKSWNGHGKENGIKPYLQRNLRRYRSKEISTDIYFFDIDDDKIYNLPR